MKSTFSKNWLFLSLFSILFFAGSSSIGQVAKPEAPSNSRYLSKPLVTNIYTADASAHVFNKTIYIYPSHDIEAGVKENDFGDHFDMKDYHVFSMKNIGGPVTDHGVALDVKDVAWAKRQMWAPDAAYKNGTYYLYFPAKDAEDIFHIGVATSTSPTGPFKAQPAPIKGSFSIDPAVFTDDDGKSYLYFGGIWGGQLQKWQSGKFDPTYGQEPNRSELALSPKMAKLTDNFNILRRAIKLKPSVEAHTGLGVALQRQGQFEEATSQYREVVRLRPHHAEAHYNLGMTLGRLNRRSEAESQFVETLRLKPDHADAQTNLERIRAQ